MSGQPSDVAARLRPYLPRIVISWLQQAPGTLAQELEGTVVYVDISGFTKMSERLARHGKIGAEEVTDAIDTVFARILQVAYAYGGNLVKFGGDALLLFFGEEDHQIRAASAAFGMRQELRAQGGIPTSAGSMTLRMSVGVSSGIFSFFLVGRSHRELLVTGPAVTEAVLMESSAGPGDIVVGLSTALSLPLEDLGAQKGGGLLLRQAPTGAVSIPAEPVRIGEADQLATCIPVAIREHLLQGRSEPQHRRVTVAFLHFDGLDQTIARGQTEPAALALDELVSAVQDSAERHGITFLGSDVDTNGGKIILVAGAPDSSGDDEDRMLLALREIVEADPPIPIRVGVNSGHAFVGDVGPPYRRTYTVMGDAVNLAARIMAKAEPGQILASEAVIAASELRFETEALEPFNVKGKRHPVNALRVGRVMGSDRGEAFDELPLIGRADELDLMLGALKNAGAGDGAVLRIVGEAGIGKSRLLQEFKQNASDLRFLAVSCEPYESSTAYLPFRSLLRGIFGISSDGPSGAGLLRSQIAEQWPEFLQWLPLLGAVFDLPFVDTPEVAALDERFRRQRLEQAIGELLMAKVTVPTIFAIEDSHWMDEASRHLLAAISRRMEGMPLIVCTAGRDPVDDPLTEGRMRANTLALEPLSTQEALTFVHLATETSPLSPHVTDALVHRSGGSPRFLKALLLTIEGSGGSVEDMPRSIEGLVMAMIDRLKPRDRARVRYLSVLGMNFSNDLAIELLEAMQLEIDDAAEVVFPGLIQQDGPDGLRFRNGLVREVAYDNLPFRRRRDVHFHVGEAIEERAGPQSEDVAELLSFHFIQAHEDAKAWRYSMVAAGRATGLHANVEAMDFYLRALEAARRLPDMTDEKIAEVAELLGDVRMHLGDYREAAEAYRMARNHRAGDRLSQAGLLLKEGRLFQLEGKLPLSLKTLTRGMTLLAGAKGKHAEGVRAHLAANYAGVRATQGRYGEAIRWCVQAIEEGRSAGELNAVARALGALDIAEVSLGHSTGGAYSKEALELYEALGDMTKQAQMINNLGAFAFFQGSWDEARAWYERGRDASLKSGDVVEAAMGDANLGEILLNQGHLTEAEAQLRKALRVYRSSGTRAGEVFALSLLGATAARGGKAQDAERLLEEAQRLGNEVGDSWYSADAAVLAAESLVLQGRTDEALARTEELLASIPSTESVFPLLLRVRGYALAQAGDQAGSDEALSSSMAMSRTRGADHEMAFTLEAMLRCGSTDGRPIEDMKVQRDALFNRLGIVFVPEVPMGSRL